MDSIYKYKGVLCRLDTYRVMGEDKPALYCIDAPDDKTVHDAGFEEMHMAGPWVKILSDEEYENIIVKDNEILEEWRITGTRISSKSNADVYYGDKTVRIPGEAMVSYFLANPYEMFWLEKEDRDIWPWKLPEEKRKKKLSKTEITAVMETVNDFFRHRKDPIIFLTKEMEDRSWALAELIKDKQISRRKAVSMLKKAFPDLFDRFYKAMIIDSLAGARWYE